MDPHRFLRDVMVKGWGAHQLFLLLQELLIPVLEKQEQEGKEEFEQRKAMRGMETWNGLQGGEGSWAG